MSGELWLTPLVLMPGVALLVMSTSARYAQLHGEIHHIGHHGDCAVTQARNLFRRARMFRNALVALYATIALLVSASLAGGIGALLLRPVTGIVLGLIGAGVVTLLYAATVLARESFLSLDIIGDHVDAIVKSEAKKT